MNIREIIKYNCFQCTPAEFLGFCQALESIHIEIAKNSDQLKSDVQSTMLQNIFENLNESLAGVAHWISALEPEHTK